MHTDTHTDNDNANDNDNDNDKFIDRPQVHNITIIKKGHCVWSKLQILKLLESCTTNQTYKAYKINTDVVQNKI